MGAKRKKRLRRYQVGRYSKPWSVTAVNTGRFPPSKELWFHGSVKPIPEMYVRRAKWLDLASNHVANARKAYEQALCELERYEKEPAVIDRRITLSPKEASSWWSLQLMWSIDRKRYVFIEFDAIDDCIRESIVYTSRERAYQVFARKSIIWKRVTPITS